MRFDAETRERYASLFRDAEQRFASDRSAVTKLAQVITKHLTASMPTQNSTGGGK